MSGPFQIRKRICRLCWIKCENFEVVGKNSIDNMNMLLLKMDLVVSEEPVICTNCAERLKKCFDFKSMCLDIRDYIIQFVNDKSDAKLDLKHFCLSQNNICIPDDHDICGFCMGLVKSCSAITIDNEDGDDMLQNLMLEKCLPELDFTRIRKPIICALCHGSLEDYYQFLTSCLICEEKIKKHCETHNITKSNTDLINILQFKVSDILMSKDGNTVDTANEGKSLVNQENSDELVEVKEEDFITMEEYQKFDSVLFRSEDILNCEEEDKKGGIIKQELDFHVDEASQLTATVVNFAEMEDQKCSLSEEIEIKMDQEDLERFEDGVLPQPEVITRLRRTWNCLMPNLKEDVLKPCIKHTSTMYECDSCSYQTKLKGDLKKHLLVHKSPSEVTMYKCDSCSYQTKRNDTLKGHLLVHKSPSEVEMYKCDSCSYQTRRKYDLNKHSPIHKSPSEVTVYKCVSCSYQTRQIGYFNRHLLVHKGPSEATMYKCDSCSYHTKRKDKLKGHLLVHKSPSEVAMYKCDSCSYQTKRKDHLNRHLPRHKSPLEVAVYKCVSCSYQTRHKGYFNRHLLIHKGPLEATMYKCDSCSYQTRHKWNLNLLVHKSPSEVTIYQCDSCLYQKRQKEDLKRHLEVHPIVSPDSISWEEHITKLSTKLSRNIYFLYNLVNTESLNYLLTAYYDSFHANMLEGILDWGHSAHASNIFGLQRKCIRILSHLGYRNDCKDQFINLKILTMPCVYILECLLYLRQNEHQDVTHSEINEYTTRNSEKINANFLPLTRSRNRRDYYSARFYNTLPHSIKCLNFLQFKSKIKGYLKTKAFYSFEEFFENDFSDLI